MKITSFDPMDMPVAEAVLKEAKAILDACGVAFFLRHGTCLGAVRDGAFIPWDDDLDIGSVLGLHGLTESKVRETAKVFEEHGFHVDVIDSELHLSVDMKRHGIQMDWTCYRIVDGNIYQWPVIAIPASLHEDLLPIEFLGDTFHVPNPPEAYFELKYGPDWQTPKEAGGFEDAVLEQMSVAGDTGDSETKDVLKLKSEFDPAHHNSRLRVFDVNGDFVSSAPVSLAATSVLTGLDNSVTDNDGFVYFNLPEEACYVVAVETGGSREVLYLEELEPGTDYEYRPDPDRPVGRANALIDVGSFESG